MLDRNPLSYSIQDSYLIYTQLSIRFFSGILFIMWRNIGLSHRKHRLNDSNSEKSKRRVDCSGANRGLFFGIFVLVGAIISMIVFFVLVEKPRYVRSAVMVVHFNEIGIYCLTMIAIIVAGYKMRDMRFHKDKDNMLDEVLHVVALIGQYIFCIFCVVAGRYNTNTYGGSLVMATSVLLMLQATFQTVFILQALRRSAARQFHETKKPGREYITFLLVSNIALWGINTFQVLRTDSNPVTVKFYSILPWSIVTHVATPMAIFYRFHSTVCLANIWKNAYKSNKYH